uniref:MACPF domain-containing protein n=1 Tax=Panagrolaimus sp. ES5 TaxID=591445 RepID=A0AC34FL24_9BILA
MENSNSAEYSYNLQIKTKTERLKWDDIELQKYYDLSEIKNHGTHLIVGIQYGGNAFVTISQKLNRSSSSRKAEVQNKLGINLINFLNVGTYSDTKFPYNETMKDMDFDISVEADVSPEEGDNLITLEGAVKYVNSLNGRLSKYNNGKGVILQYEMIPLHYINSISKPYTTLSNDVIFSVNEKLFYLEAINKK